MGHIESLKKRGAAVPVRRQSLFTLLSDLVVAYPAQPPKWGNRSPISCARRIFILLPNPTSKKFGWQNKKYHMIRRNKKS